MVFQNTTPDCSSELHTAKRQFIDSSVRSQQGASVTENETSSVSFIRTTLKGFGLPANTTDILFDSWRNSTKQQYGTYLKKWVQFCDKKQTNPFETSVNLTLEFLTELFLRGLGYSAINTARSALSSILDTGKDKLIGTHPLICRFMKGVYNKRPSFPRYQLTWDVDVVLAFLCTYSPVYTLTLKKLTLKFVMLLSLLTAQRIQTLEIIDLKDCVVEDEELVIKISKLIKTSKPGMHLSDIHLPAYHKDKALCIVDTFNAYVERTKTLQISIQTCLLQQ